MFHVLAIRGGSFFEISSGGTEAEALNLAAALWGARVSAFIIYVS